MRITFLTKRGETLATCDFLQRALQEHGPTPETEAVVNAWANKYELDLSAPGMLSLFMRAVTQIVREEALKP